MDWFDYLKQYEDAHGEHYGVTTNNGLIELWSLSSLKTVGLFTKEQLTMLLKGLINQDGEITINVMRERINDYLEVLYEAQADYTLRHDNMTEWERYCYLSEWVKEL